MALPAGLPTILVTGSFIALDGSVVPGRTVVFDAGQRITDTAGNVIIDGPVTKTVDDATGIMDSVVFPYTDDTALSPTGFTITVTELINGTTSAQYDISLPTVFGPTVDLSDLVPVNPSGGVSTVYGVLAQPNTWTGANTFDAEVTVPTPVNPGDAATKAYVDAHAGGGVASVFGRGGAVTAQTGDYTAAQVTGAATAASVTAETNRATTAEGLLAPLAGAAFTGNVSVTESSAAGGLLVVTNSHATPSTPSAQYIAQSAADLLIGLDVTGDAFFRYTVDSNGKQAWGPGTAASDVSMIRSGSSRLQVSGNLTVQNAPGTPGNILNVSNTGSTAPTSPNVQLTAKASGDPELGIGINSDTVLRLVADSNGKLSWGPGGSTAADVVLQRSAAGVLQLTTGQLNLNSQKITAMANGSAATDGVAFGQLGGAAFLASAAVAQTANNLSDLASVSTARTNLGLGTAATAALTALLQAANNLSDLGSAATARTNLGLGTAATAALTALLQASNNLSDLGSASTARTNLGLGTAATLASSAVAQTANNLSDLGSASTARTNLGLGTAATQNSTAFDAAGTATGLIDTTATDIQPLGTQAAGSTGKSADAAHVHPLVSGFLPSDMGLLEWNYDPAVASTSSALATSGQITLIRVPVRVARSITNVTIVLTAAGATLTSGQNFAAVITSGGTVVGTSADQTASWGSATGLLTIPLSGGPFSVNAGWVWVALLWNGTTGPTLLRQSNTSTAGANLGLGPSSARFAHTAGGLTAMPASITPSANTLTQITYWAGLS